VAANTFNVTAAESAGGPESTPGSQPTGSSTTAAAIATSPSTAKAKAKSSKSNAGAIAGGIVGGVIFLGIVAGLAFFIMRRRTSRPSQPMPSTYSSVAYNSVGSPGTMMGYGEGKDNLAMPTPMVSGRVYDPNDPTTFPTHDSAGYNTSPDFNQRGPVTPSFTGNATLVAPVVPGRTQYTGAPEL